MFKGSRAQNRVLNFADSEVKECVIFFQSFQLFAVLFNILIRKEVIGNVEICSAWKVLFHVNRWSQERIKNNNTRIPIVLEFRSLSLIRLFMCCTRLRWLDTVQHLHVQTAFYSKTLGLIRLSRILSYRNHKSSKFQIEITARAWSHEPGKQW